MFSFEWVELERALENLAASPAQKERVRSFVGGIQNHAATLDVMSAAGRIKVLELIWTTADYTQAADPQALLEELLREDTTSEQPSGSHLH
jgi:hypothetical protein